MFKTSKFAPSKTLKKYSVLASLIAAAVTAIPAQATTLKNQSCSSTRDSG
ncbi:hypothetical protein LN249_19050 [Vibrio alginolyticus]|nr:hypothetical protein LN249_19050 [Vibrio alginolyticus]